MDLSMVIPAYNAAAFLEDRLGVLSDYLSAADRPWSSWEIVVVDDGSSDATVDVMRSASIPHLVPIESPHNEGKFGAVVRGMAASSGRVRIFTDADVPYVCDHIAEMARRVLDGGAHVVVGDRTLAASHYKEELSPLRRMATDGFKLLTRLLVTSDLADTQCGLKAFRADVADALFPLMVERGFAGDVELLTIAQKHALRVERVPVVLAFHGETTVRPFADGIKMAQALARIRWRLGRGVYESPELERVARR